MYVRETMGTCDCGTGTGSEYTQCTERASVQAVARGATGRYCYVLGWCVACFEQEGLDILADTVSVEQARKMIEEKGDGYPDF